MRRSSATLASSCVAVRHPHPDHRRSRPPRRRGHLRRRQIDAEVPEVALGFGDHQARHHQPELVPLAARRGQQHPGVPGCLARTQDTPQQIAHDARQQVFVRHRQPAVAPALTDLGEKWRRHPFHEAACAKRDQRVGEKAIERRAIETLERGDRRSHAAGTWRRDDRSHGRLGNRRADQLLERALAQARHVADRSARRHRPAQETQVIDVTGAVETRPARAAGRRHHRVAAFPGANDVRREPGQPRDRPQRQRVVGIADVRLRFVDRVTRTPVPLPHGYLGYAHKQGLSSFVLGDQRKSLPHLSDICLILSAFHIDGCQESDKTRG